MSVGDASRRGKWREERVRDAEKERDSERGRAAKVLAISWFSGVWLRPRSEEDSPRESHFIRSNLVSNKFKITLIYNPIQSNES